MKRILGPLSLAISGLVSLCLLSPFTHSPYVLVKFSALIVPMAVTAAGMVWLITRMDA